ncbi:MAG: zinc-binding dehydrogenase, partial [Clostridia bacterium]|nr:zinc-binding dehydrogenase [Clostridia bacterium]
KDGGVYLHANPKIRQMLFKFFIKKGNGKRLIIKKPEEEEIELEEITGFASKEIIKPIIDRSIGLDEVAWAHEYVEAGRKKGSLVVLVDDNQGT